ncbi:unnamed protein product [Phytophthora fragariaefolia]|uniref:beta-glucosidase n=1 Tax=Phytophthora fragariaefolia TaxID=1490495 RepID=A0A9W6YCH1_9STRA|nr:unnamed protein product [Phytophthora fragariaefolia]
MKEWQLDAARALQSSFSNLRLSVRNYVLRRINILKMLRAWLGAVCCAAVGLTAARSIDEYDNQARVIVDNLSTEQVLGQLAQVAISAMLNDDYSLNETLVRDYAKLKIGSYLTTPFTGGPNDVTGEVGWDVAQWRDIITRIQEIAMEENDGIPMVYGIDTVHGAGFILNSTMFGAQLNGAASFNPDLVFEMGRIGAQDTRAAGIPWVFGPILEIASNPL